MCGLLKVGFLVLWTILAHEAMASKDQLDMMSSEFTVKGHNKRVVCYWGTWANYRPKLGKFTPEDVDASLCTNLIYSFAGLDAENDSIKPLDPWMDLEDGYGLQGYRKATDLKYAYPHLKVSAKQIKNFLWYLFFNFQRSLRKLN